MKVYCQLLEVKFSIFFDLCIYSTAMVNSLQHFKF